MMLVLLAMLLLGSQLGEVVGLPPNYEDIDMTLQFAGWCWCCCLCCCWSASWVKFSPFFVTVHDTTQFAGWCWCCWLCCCWAASWVKFLPSFVTVHGTTICRMMLVLLPVLLFVTQLGEISPFFCNSAWHYNLQDDVGVVGCVAVGQPAGWNFPLLL